MLNWIKNIKVRSQNRIAHRYMEEYKQGYGWAWSEYKIEGMSIEVIESYCYGIDSNTFFDKGAQLAAKEIQQYEDLKLRKTALPRTE